MPYTNIEGQRALLSRWFLSMRSNPVSRNGMKLSSGWIKLCSYLFRDGCHPLRHPIVQNPVLHRASRTEMFVPHLWVLRNGKTKEGIGSDINDLRPSVQLKSSGRTGGTNMIFDDFCSIVPIKEIPVSEVLIPSFR